MTTAGTSAAPLRVSLASTLRVADAPADAGVPLLDAAGPDACIGGAGDALAVPVQPSAATLFGPRGACLLGDDGPLWVADTGHHRLLGWARRPRADAAAADWLIGQPAFDREGRNARGEPSATTLNVPTGLSGCGVGGLAVADAWNHRVLIWHRAPRASGVPADRVLGQADFHANAANRGHDAPSAVTLHWPYGVHWDGERLWVADCGNRRVLMWHGLPQRDGQPADLVLGQRDFACRDENAGGDPCAVSMRWPHGVLVWGGRLVVTDAGNNRLMVWDRIPVEHGAPCDHLLGQDDDASVDHNRSRYWPDAASLNMPYGIAAAGDWLIVADTANSRLVGWHRDDIRTGARARALAAQPDFRAKGDNRWQAPARDSLCWPYGVACCGAQVAVCDSGNNRVLVRATATKLRA